MKLISPAISRLARLRYTRMEDWMNEPIAAQRQVLKELVTRGNILPFPASSPLLAVVCYIQ